MNRKDLSKEFLVGCLVIFVLLLLFIFGWLMGVVGPLNPQVRYSVLYAFAGGVEVGSPVRVSGVKVGKVEKIEFLPSDQTLTETQATLRVTIGISKAASEVVRDDSRFYVNMAGIIGERYVEISPGTFGAKVLNAGSTVRGVDPPRIDQLLSQGYGVFGRVQEFMDANEKTITDFLKQMNHFMTDANKLLKGSDKQQFLNLIQNMNDLAIDAKGLTKRLHEARTEEFFDQLMELVRRAHEIDKPALKKFLQEEGIRARIF